MATKALNCQITVQMKCKFLILLSSFLFWVRFFEAFQLLQLLLMYFQSWDRFWKLFWWQHFLNKKLLYSYFIMKKYKCLKLLFVSFHSMIFSQVDLAVTSSSYFFDYFETSILKILSNPFASLGFNNFILSLKFLLIKQIRISAVSF